MNRLLALALVVVAVPCFGQALSDAHRFDLYASPDAASTALESLMASQRETALIIPFRHDLSAFTSENLEGVTYAVAYQAAPWESNAVQANVTMNTRVWFGPDTCGYGMKSWAVKSFASVADAKAFYDGLIPLQKGTAYLLPTAGPQLQRYRYIVVFQNLAANCY